ncbi:MAG: quinol:cytochrome C oxidoreductase [Planctomycetes bacterium]|nr:quinol:cytochrome C oxidoreductase [Planctomycetota bacterium]
MSQSAPVINLSTANIRGESLSTPGQLMRLLGLAILAGSFLMGLNATDQGLFLRTWMQAWLFVTTVSLGALFFLIVQHITHAGWSVVVRRPAEALASNLQWLWIGFLPFVFYWWKGQLDFIFPWANLEALKHISLEEAELVAKKSAFLNDRFFMIRAAIYLVTWFALSKFFVGNSFAQDSDGSVARTKKLEKWAGPAAILFGVTTSFAAFDWIMSLNPAWFSTMFGVYFFVGCCTGGFACLGIVCLRLQQLGYLKGVITSEHYQDIGKLLFAFGVVFWAYIAFSQYMLIWYGNIPEETAWFLARQIGEWRVVSVVLLFGHFILPFLFLISRWTKRWRGTLFFACVWMLAAQWFDLYYLIHPHIPHDIGTFSTYDQILAKYAGESAHFLNPWNWVLLAGFWLMMVGTTLRRLGSMGLLCVRDPRLAESLRFENI